MVMSRESMAAAFLLLVHDEFSGRPRCSADLLRCGLVGAELAELVIAGRLGVSEGRLHPLDADPLGNSRRAAEYVMECVLGQPRQHTVRTWTENLGDPLHEMIVVELVADSPAGSAGGARSATRRWTCCAPQRRGPASNA
jgi:hypothetical protein